ncbi:MAG: TerB family tellurite resistance protein, partial [Acidobacteriota bacterium]|nr:TerB family tellurite resistance protein [Acidobacteriota bacterium]
MANDPKRIAALILARMAACDGKVDDAERELLADLTGHAPDDPALQAVFDEAQTADLAQLFAGLVRYADRFFVVLRAYMMAHVDARYDVAEESFYHQMLNTFEISEQDRELIRESQASLYSGNEE